jgi:hypothetical protein
MRTLSKPPKAKPNQQTTLKEARRRRIIAVQQKG